MDTVNIFPTQESFRSLVLLGQSIRLQYRKVWVQMLEAALTQQPPSPNEFFLMYPLLISKECESSKQVWLLRVEDWEYIHSIDASTSVNALRCAIVGSFYQTQSSDAVWGFSRQFSLTHADKQLGVYSWF